MRHWRAVAWAAIAIATLAPSAVRAVDAVNISVDASAIDLTEALERPKGDGDRVQVSTAADAEGIVRRIEVRSREPGPHWVVFALANNGTDQIDRLLVAPRYRMVGSGLLWPDLGASRLVVFRRVFLPLSMPGLVAAGVLVFIVSLGFYITPAILGGGKTLMAAEWIKLQILDPVRWGMGAMLATVLVAAILATLAVFSRVVDLRRMFGAGR